MEYWNADKEEKQSRKKSLLITVLFNVFLFLVFYFVVVWQQPIPPLPTFGLELNLGFSSVGSGELTSSTAPSEQESTSIEAASPGEVVQESVEIINSSPKTEIAKPKVSSQKTENQAVSTKPSPVKGSEKSVESTIDPKAAQKEPVKRTTPTIGETENLAQKTTVKPRIDQRAVMGAGGTSGKGLKPATGGSQGSSTVKGDAGDPKGTVDGRAILGTGTGKGANSGAGYSLDLDGWDFASRPMIKDNVSTRNGRIVFKITVDDVGSVIQAIPLEYNVSNEVLAYYRQVVNLISFKNQGGTAAEFSSGKITFVIKVD